MKIVIVGCGNIGATLTGMLVKEDHDVVVIDRNSDVLTHCVEAYDAMAVTGNAVSPDVQKEAGVDTADLLIATTSADEINLLCCFLAKKLGCRHTIARVRNEEYMQQIRLMREDLGLSMTINPEESAAREIYGLLQFPSFLHRDSMAKGTVELVSLHIRSDSQLCGMMLSQISRLARIKLLVCAVERGSQVYVPDGKFVLEDGDNIFVTAARSDLVRLVKNLCIGDNHKAKSVFILGGGRTSLHLARKLESSGVGVKIVENDIERCQQLSEFLPGSLIIQGDPSSSELLLSEGIDNADAVVTLTDSDEGNLVLSMFVSHLGVPKTVTKLDRMEFGDIFSGVGSIISPQIVSVNEIIAYVRDMQNTQGGEVMAIHRILDGRIEALEFYANDSARCLKVPLEQLSLKKGILIACITRGGKLVVPTGKDFIMSGDVVIVIASSTDRIHSLNDILANGHAGV